MYSLYTNCNCQGPYCGFKSNEVQSGAEIQERGVRFEVTVSNKTVYLLVNS